MDKEFDRTPEFFEEEELDESNPLMQYVQSMSPEAINCLSRPASSEVMQVMEDNIAGLLGNLPLEDFGMKVTTSRENLGHLLASAMMNGYFLRNVEQRMAFEHSFINPLDRHSSDEDC